jgi:Outer membrane lipoprotein carrier protein LolA-like
MRWMAVLTLNLWFAGAVAEPQPAPDTGLFEHPVSAAHLLQTTLSQPAAELSAAKVLTGKFVQRRYLRGLDRPLISSGDFMMAREQGILWRTATPFASEFVLTTSGMTVRDGASATHLSSAERPALRAALEMFFALFALDVARLGDSFELYGAEQGEHWQVGLRPRQGGLAQVFEQAVISGARTVERIELSSAGGDRTEIELSDTQTRTTALDAGEAARFRE